MRTNDSPKMIVETYVPARLDRLPWGRFHTRVVVALGITWILDGLEVTLAGTIAGALEASPVLAFSAGDIGLASSLYLAGAVSGALVFGRLTDRLGRRRLFFVTLGLYLVATAASGLAWNLASFCFFRFLTGAGIGGEYAAVNSTIQELIPARYRGATDIAINGSFWIGGALGAASSILLLDPRFIDPEMGWRLCFLIGAGLGLLILLLRGSIPESPRWLVLHGRADEAEATTGRIEADFRRRGVALEDVASKTPLRLLARRRTPLSEVLSTLFVAHRTQALVGLALLVTQAFFYNAIFFTYALVLTRFYAVPADHVGWYIMPFALGNVLGPLCLGRLFDTIGRKPMIAFTYCVSGLLLAATGFLFARGGLGATGQTIAWTVVFFFASAAASSAYLTVSETFPIEIRALAIAIFYAAGTAFGGVAAPYLFGLLIGTGSREAVLVGYLIGAGLMLAAGIVEAIWGVAAERKPLESVARPLSALDERSVVSAPPRP
jgi:MFS family permease